MAQPCYVIGRIQSRFPNLGVEKELAQAIGAAAVKVGPSPSVLKKALSDPRYRYIALQMCWVMAIDGIDLFIVNPTSSTELDWLVESLREDGASREIDVVIGQLGSTVPASACNGAMLPAVTITQLYSFQTDALAAQLTPPPTMDAKNFPALAKKAVLSALASSRNMGLSDEQRAINYLVTRSSDLLILIAQQLADEASLVAVHGVHNELMGRRQIVDVVFSFVPQKQDRQRHFSASVDVTDLFPFLVNPLAPYLMRR